MIHQRHDPVQRVNEKHGDELLTVARTLASHPEATSARAVRVDADGIDLAVSTPEGLVEAHVDFLTPVSDPKRFRAAFRELTRRAQAASTPGAGGPPTS